MENVVLRPRPDVEFKRLVRMTGLLQQEVADKAGVSRSHLAQLSSSKRQCSALTAMSVAAALGRPTLEVFEVVSGDFEAEQRRLVMVGELAANELAGVASK